LTINDKITLLFYILKIDSELKNDSNEKKFIKIIKEFRKDDVELVSEYFEKYEILEEYFNKYKKDLQKGKSEIFKNNYKYTINYLNYYELEEKNDLRFNNFLKDIKKIFNDDNKIEEKCDKIPNKHLSGEFYYKYVKEKVKHDTFIGAQCLQQTIKKVDKAYASFYKLMSNGIYACKPDYLDKDGKFNVIFQKNSFKIKKIGNSMMVVLALGKGMKKKYKELFEDSKDIIIINDIYYGYKNKILKYAKLVKKGVKRTENYFFKYNKEEYYISKKNAYLYRTDNIYFNIGKKIAKYKISEVELNCIHNGNTYELILKYKKKMPIIKTIDDKNKARKDNNNKILALDSGMVNTEGMVTNFLDNPNIIDGKKLLGINVRYNEIMDKYKSKIKKEYNANTSVNYRNLLYRKSCILSDYMHKISNAIVKYAKEKGIGTIVIGYNPNWKSRINLGKKTNRKFYEIPFRKLINMLFYKGADNGILVVEVKESYTSKCDALALESIKHHDEYLGDRKKRGLFKSSTGHCINADINGALNILRKYIYYYKKEAEIKKLDKLIKNKEYIAKLKRPKKIYYETINRENVDEIPLKTYFLNKYKKPDSL